METVILIHGLWMHGIALLPQQRWLARRGFSVRRFSYPSMRHGLQQNARALSQFVAATGSVNIHLVGHSLGGLVALSMLAQYPDPRVRRVVLMGSPCMGSHCASVLLRRPSLAAIVGHSLKEWLTLPLPQLPGQVEIGVLSGSRSIGLGRLIPGLPRPNDGAVSVAETRLPDARDFITLHVSHTEMLISHACADQVAAFLKRGSFKHA
jgi:pimeloyl-ACP methyl ester carboxylesterase